MTMTFLPARLDAPPRPSPARPGPSRGSDEAWLLREAVDRHRKAVARATGRPATLRDRAGVPVRVAIASARLDHVAPAGTGDAGVGFDCLRAPTPATGWTSLWRARGGASATVEIASRFVACDGGASGQLDPSADMPDAWVEACEGALPPAARELRARREALRAAAPPGAAPLASRPVLAAADRDGDVAPPDVAGVLRLILAAEAAAAGPWPLSPVARRELHWYADAALGERIEVDCVLHVALGARARATHTLLAARRASDGALVATSEVARGGDA